MPKLTNMPGPDYIRIRKHKVNFAASGELTQSDILTVERVLKLAAECTQIDLTDLEACDILSRVCNPLRDSIGMGCLHVAPVFPKGVSLMIEPDAA